MTDYGIVKSTVRPEAKEQLERVEQLSDGKSAYEVAVDKTIIRFKK